MIMKEVLFKLLGIMTNFFISIFLVILNIFAHLFVFVWLVFDLSYYCPALHGIQSLGNHLEYDYVKRPCILLGISYDRKVWRSATHFIPTNDNIQLGEYVEEVVFDDKWVLVKTTHKVSHQKKFYIVDKGFRYVPGLNSPDFIYENFVTEYSDSLEFAEACRHNAISLKWEKK